MPELPEVESLVRLLRPHLVNQIIAAYEMPKRLRGGIQMAELIGQTITGLERCAKLVLLETGKATAVFHLMLNGQFILIPVGNGTRLAGGHPAPDMLDELPGKTTRLILHLASGSRLYLNDSRNFASVELIPPNSLELLRSRHRYGPDPLSTDFTDVYLQSILARRPRSTIKEVLLDQSVAPGIGNICADESLFLAGIHPATSAADLGEVEVARLMKGITETLEAGIRRGGSANEARPSVKETRLAQQQVFNVYSRKGMRCLRCGATIERTVIGGRGTHYCPKCQPLISTGLRQDTVRSMPKYSQ